jgi:hypothetical protein
MTRLLALLLLCAAVPAWAQVDAMIRDPGADPPPLIAPRLSIEERELAATLPDKPRPADLVEVGNIPEAQRGLRLYLDRRALSLGADGIIRYSAVVELPGGTRNTVYEGLDCGAAQVRRYAFAVGDAPFEMYRDNRWMALAAWHAYLVSEVLCDRYDRPRSPRAALDHATAYPQLDAPLD